MTPPPDLTVINAFNRALDMVQADNFRNGWPDRIRPTVYTAIFNMKRILPELGQLNSGAANTNALNDSLKRTWETMRNLEGACHERLRIVDNNNNILPLARTVRQALHLIEEARSGLGRILGIDQDGRPVAKVSPRREPHGGGPPHSRHPSTQDSPTRPESKLPSRRASGVPSGHGSSGPPSRRASGVPSDHGSSGPPSRRASGVPSGHGTSGPPSRRASGVPSGLGGGPSGNDDAIWHDPPSQAPIEHTADSVRMTFKEI